MLRRAQINAAVKSAVLTAVDFTSDHGLLLDKGGDKLEEVSKEAKLFSLAGAEWQKPVGKGAPTVNNPISHTRDKNLELTAKWTSVNIGAGKPYQVVGVVTAVGFGAPAAGFTLKSAVLNTVGGAETTAVASTQKLSKLIGKWSFQVEWSVVLNPAAAQPDAPLPMGTSKGHVVYQTYGKPVGAGLPGNKKGEYAVTEERMALAVNKFQQATVNAANSMAAAAQGGTLSPAAQLLLAQALLNGEMGDAFKPARLAFHLIKLHNQSNVSVVQVGKDGINAQKSRGWLVPASWQTTGANCVSGATFTEVASYMVGLPGSFGARDYMPIGVEKKHAKTAKDLLEVRSDLRDDFLIKRFRNDKTERAVLFLGTDAHEHVATIVYTYNPTPNTPNTPDKTILIPVGVPQNVVYDKEDDCLTVFKSFEWAKRKNGAPDGIWVPAGDEIVKYTTAPGIPLSQLDE